jgi:pimeloyl-ACP methyl ester carboxylesterase
MPVVKLLADGFTCYSMDRRGRAKSGVGVGSYSIEREYEDIGAVLAAAGPGAALAAHSFGATCALGAAMRYPVRRLVLYEPPSTVGGLIAGEHLKAYVRTLEDGDPDKALELGLAWFPHFPPEAITALRTSRGWPRVRAMAKSWIRELEAMDALSADMEPYRKLRCPSMLLVGDQSPEHPMQDSSRALAKVLPGVRVEPLVGQGHGAMRLVPDKVAYLIRGFLAK